jgi:hypothetical protein
MSFTIDFLLLIILVVIPGLLFKRFYFQGEFSKQFSTKDSVYKSVFYSIIPGVLIQLLGYIIYIGVRKHSFTNKDLLCVFEELFTGSDNYSEITTLFVQKGISNFILHEFNVYLLAVFIGYFSYLVVRTFKLDVKLKILRFKNQWYYIFSGEFKSFKKFEKAKQLFREKKTIEQLLKPNSDNQFKYFPVRADVLVKEDSKVILYTGYVIDYDLDYENINDLDKLYLYRTHRYREVRDEDKNNKQIKIIGNKAKIPIKGDVFLLDAKNILNLNLTFVPHSLVKNKKEVFKRKIKKLWLIVGGLINLFFIIYILVINTTFFTDLTLFSNFFTHELNWFERLLIALIVTQLFSILLPTQERNKKRDVLGYKYSWKSFFSRVFLAVIFTFIFYLKYFKF